VVTDNEKSKKIMKEFDYSLDDLFKEDFSEDFD
jgi:hypothetical protein